MRLVLVADDRPVAGNIRSGRPPAAGALRDHAWHHHQPRYQDGERCGYLKTLTPEHLLPS